LHLLFTIRDEVTHLLTLVAWMDPTTDAHQYCYLHTELTYTTVHCLLSATTYNKLRTAMAAICKPLIK